MVWHLKINYDNTLCKITITPFDSSVPTVQRTRAADVGSPWRHGRAPCCQQLFLLRCSPSAGEQIFDQQHLARRLWVEPHVLADCAVLTFVLMMTAHDCELQTRSPTSSSCSTLPDTDLLPGQASVCCPIQWRILYIDETDSSDIWLG